jgi:hypothetical protein
MNLKCKFCGHEGDGVLYNPFKKKNEKFQFPFIMLVGKIGEACGKYLGFETEEEMGLYYKTDEGKDENVWWERFEGNTNYKGTWKFIEVKICKNCNRKQ